MKAGDEMKVALISCTSSKKEYPCKASEMYTPSPRFALAYQYAKQVADVVYVLSAKHGLLCENEVIEPYNETLNDKSTAERRSWASGVLKSLEERHSLETDEFIILAGRVYNEFLLSSLKRHSLPLEGQSMGRWIPKLKELLNKSMNREDAESSSLMIHKWMTQLPRYHWDQINSVPFQNGIYIMFETGEKLYGMDRIVRIGTHRADGRLKERLKDHFLKENKDGSILRKNVGLSLLHRERDPFEAIWALDWSKPSIKNEYANGAQSEQKKANELAVSSYLRNNISFTCILVEDEKDRLRVEEALIATLNNANDFVSSAEWLGRHSPKPEIVNSGLWNTQGLNGKILSCNEVEVLKKAIMGGSRHLVNRISTKENLKEKIKPEVKANNVQAMAISRCVSTSDIKGFIAEIIERSRQDGLPYVDIVSGEIHKKMKLSSKMPSVCSAMYGLMKENDVILHTTPSGKSSTIKIRYFLT